MTIEELRKTTDENELKEAGMTIGELKKNVDYEELKEIGLRYIRLIDRLWKGYAKQEQITCEQLENTYGLRLVELNVKPNRELVGIVLQKELDNCLVVVETLYHKVTVYGLSDNHEVFRDWYSYAFLSDYLNKYYCPDWVYIK